MSRFRPGDFGVCLHDAIHDRGALGEGRPDLVPVHRLGARRAAVPDQVPDVLKPASWAIKMDTNECRSSRGVPCPTQPRGLSELLELLPYGPAIWRRAIFTAEHQAALLPHLPRREPLSRLAGCGVCVAPEPPEWAAPRRAGSCGSWYLTLDPDGAVYGHRASAEVDLAPLQRSGLLEVLPMES
jgi:hypothetical protein